MSRYNLIQLDLESEIRRANLVAVKKDKWDLSKSTLTEYLSTYERSNVKLGQLEGTFDGKNRYLLEEYGPKYFDLLILVSNTISLEDTSLDLTTLNIIGAIEIPLIGVDLEDTVQRIQIDFIPQNPIVVLNPDINNEVEQTFDISQYTPDVLNSEGVSKGDLSSTYPIIYRSSGEDFDEFNTSRLSNSNKKVFSTFSYDDYCLGSKVLRGETSLNLDIPFTIKEVYELQAFDHTFLYIEDESQNKFLLSFSDRTNTNFSDFSYSTRDQFKSVLLKENRYTTWFTPDVIIIRDNRTYLRYSYPYNLYCSRGYTKVSDITDLTEKRRINGSYYYGLDVASQETSLVISKPKEKEFFLQPKHRNLMRNSKVDLPSGLYTLEKHNNKLFIINEISKSEDILNKYCLDYKGNLIRIPNSKYFLGIDGHLITQHEGSYIAYLGSLDNSVKLNSMLDFYTLYPNLPAFNLKTNKIDLTKLVILRGLIYQAYD